jgi:hypothetical protein
METTMTDILTLALEHAATDHGIYEAEVLGGVRHTGGAQWYAQHMARSLRESGYRLVRE